MSNVFESFDEIIKTAFVVEYLGLKTQAKVKAFMHLAVSSRGLQDFINTDRSSKPYCQTSN